MCTALTSSVAVVPGYYLVCYNDFITNALILDAVVPGYYLVCYNSVEIKESSKEAVVPGYYLVCYNPKSFPKRA